MDAAAKKLLKKQERLKKKAKAAARKQSKQSDAQGSSSTTATSAQPPPATKKAKSLHGPKPIITQKAANAGFEYEGNEKFLTPAHPDFYKLLAASYQGFVHEPAATIDASFHRAAKRAFETLRDKSYFQYDVVMAGGKNLSRTFVRRTLVGEPGITYKYLGLRIFAHAWSGSTGVAPWFKAIHSLNTQMTTRTQRAMQKASNPMGSCAYNLTLINYMEPLSNWDLGLKDDETYGLGKTSVSWHADSSLQDFSAIGVYNCMLEDPHKKTKKPPTKGKKRTAFGDDKDAQEKDWRIALRLAPEQPVNESGKSKKRTAPASGVKPATKSGKALPPAVSMATRDGDAYYLLGDFNHAHQHMVLTGSSVRVSTTHRVAVESDSTLASILARLEAAYDLSRVSFIKDSDTVRLLTPQHVLKEQSALTELEMEWIRQYWIQGKQHDVLHVDWQKPMRELERVHWRRLESRTRHCLDLVLQDEAEREDAQGVCWQLSDRLKIVNVLLQELTQRQKRRGLFRQRIQDKAYRRIASEFQPVERPAFEASSAMPYDLAPQLQLLEALKTRLKKQAP